MKWTTDLAAAARAVRDEPAPHPCNWPDSDADVRSRASEFATVQPGYEPQPFQLEYLECFVQRLDFSLGGVAVRPSHAAFKLALEAARGSRCTTCGETVTGPCDGGACALELAR